MSSAASLSLTLLSSLPCTLSCPLPPSWGSATFTPKLQFCLVGKKTYGTWAFLSLSSAFLSLWCSAVRFIEARFPSRFSPLATLLNCNGRGCCVTALKFKLGRFFNDVHPFCAALQHDLNLLLQILQDLPGPGIPRFSYSQHQMTNLGPSILRIDPAACLDTFRHLEGDAARKQHMGQQNTVHSTRNQSVLGNRLFDHETSKGIKKVPKTTGTSGHHFWWTRQM
ncbi:hypothetical protein B0H13DRAFT_1889201 [Mycena leptocephala]|nr:hypothetical protein B0H13DRAFT_1889201 [Mycena leptocephala]